MTLVADLSRRFSQSRDLLRLTPFATDTAEGRSKERHRRMLFSSLASAVARAISIVAALISVPLTLHYLGAERYGMWLALSSFLALLSFADLGLGNGLLNRIAAAHGQDDRIAIRGYVSSGFGMLTLIAMCILTIFWIAYPFVPWSGLFNVSDPVARAEAGPAIAVFAVCFALSIPAAIVQKVQVGLQESFVASVWQGLGSVLALVGVIAATWLQLGLPWLVLAFLGGPLVAAVLNSLIFFLRHQADIAPRPAAFSASLAVQTLRTGLLFLVLQVVAAASYSSDPLIIAHVLGPAAVPQYAVPERMFSLVGMVIALGLAPLWPAYGEAISRGDHAWVRKTVLRSIALAMGVAAIGSTILALAGPTLLHFWVGSAIQATPLLLGGLAVWKIIEAGGGSIAMFLNGAHVVRSQVAMAAFTAVSAVLMKFILLPIFGVAIAPVSMIASYVLFTAIPSVFIITRMISKQTSAEASL